MSGGDKIRMEALTDGVAVLTLADPDRRNAIGSAMKAELERAVEALSQDDSVRVLVVTAEGSAFCAGADLPEIFGPPVRSLPEMTEFLRSYYQSFLRLLTLRVPTIAAIQGPAIGAGLNLALACDIRLAGPAARFGATFSRIGLHPGGGCTFFLVRALGRQRALRMLLEGAVLDSDEAVAQRLVDERVEDPHAAAIELASQIAALDPQLATDIKRSVNIADRGDFDASLEFETSAQAASAGKDGIQAAVARFAAGRHEVPPAG